MNHPNRLLFRNQLQILQPSQIDIVSQAELKFFTAFPSKETLKLLLEWQALYGEVQAEKKRLSVISSSDAIKLLNLPARKLTQYIREGYIHQRPNGEIYKYQVLQLLVDVKQEELFQSIR